MAQIISGKELAARIKQRVSGQVEELKAGGVTPCLAVVLVGDDPASAVYVRGKESDCKGKVTPYLPCKVVLIPSNPT